LLLTTAELVLVVTKFVNFQIDPLDGLDELAIPPVKPM
jgi:hypothetical protein